ncbi:MBL fold metallo-hydrolase [Cloacibacterium normanense]|uniref:MBL fold metallo-hydrolase n=1 Tax=Cloacibacterium normanense TaxID=237258 RepID=UPI00391AF7BF
MKLKFLGTGTSQGIPVIGSTHPVCLSTNPKDKRLRSSVMITDDEGKKILIDCGPDFRQQMLTNQESNVDALLITHEHNDHIIGLDDLRPIIFQKRKDISIYCLSRVGKEIQNRFPYAFTEDKYPGAPSFEIIEIGNEPFIIENTEITPIQVIHYKLPILGYKFKNLAYITDASFISEEEQEKLKNLDVLIINCLRKDEPHVAHYILPEILELVEKLQPKTTYLTHISNRFGFHDEIEAMTPINIHPAYDGLEIAF